LIKMSEMSECRKYSAIWDYFNVDATNSSIAICKQLSGSGSGQIVHLLSGTIRFRPDFKNCYPVHP